jgi:hypothetical protein
MMIHKYECLDANYKYVHSNRHENNPDKISYTFEKTRVVYLLTFLEAMKVQISHTENRNAQTNCFLLCLKVLIYSMKDTLLALEQSEKYEDSQSNKEIYKHIYTTRGKYSFAKGCIINEQGKEIEFASNYKLKDHHTLESLLPAQDEDYLSQESEFEYLMNNKGYITKLISIATKITVTLVY